MSKLSDFISSSKRIFIVSKKPSWKEFSVMAKVTGLGILIVGIIGYILEVFFKITGIGF
jgi:protein transport protein SEC61 subunit gamma-like protein